MRLPKFRNCRKEVLGLLVFSLSLSLPTFADLPQKADGVRDVYNREIVDASGRGRNYSREESVGLAAVLMPQTAAPQKNPVRIDRIAPNDFTLAWHRVEFGVGIGATGLVFVDWTGSGQPQLVAAGGKFGFWEASFWYIVSQSGANLSTGFATTEYADTITAILAIDADGDGDQELLVAHGKTFEIWDAEGGDPSLVRSTTTTATEIRGLEYADVDGDGRAEFVFCSGSDLKVQDSITGVTDHQRLGIGCRDVAVGNVDNDPTLEIVIGDDTSASEVISGAGFATEWTNPGGFGKIVRIGDVDGDGIGEIVAAYAWYSIKVFDAVAQAQQLAIATPQDLGALRLLDTTGDGLPEVLFGDGQWGDVHVLNGATGAQLALIDNPEHGVTDIAYGDSDLDGQKELLWGAGFSSSGEDHLYVWNLPSASMEAISVDDDGPYYGFDAGDVDADGNREIVHSVFSSRSGYGGGSVVVRDATSRATEYLQAAPLYSDYRARHRVALAQLDGDAPLEIVETRHQQVAVFDGATFAQQWAVTTTASYDFLGLAVADLDLDGNNEVVVSTNRYGSGVEIENYLLVYDGATGALEWQSPSLGSYFLNYAFLRLANVDGDAALEMVVAEEGGELQIWDGQSHLRQLLTGSLDITAMTTADIDQDGQAEIYIGTGTGNLRQINPATGSILTTYSTYAGGAIQGLEVLDIDGDSFADHIFTVGGKLSVRDGASGALVWQTARLGSNTARYGSLEAGDFNGNGDLEIWLSLGPVGMMIFERPHTNTPPVVTINAPTTGFEITVGDSLTFAGSAVDFEEGNLAGSLAWTSSLTGPIGSGASFATTSLPVGTHLITASVTDGFGELGTDSITVYVRTLPVTRTFNSIGAEDGYVLESSENSEVGNYATATQWRLGDANKDGQYRSLLSFDTSALPEDAIIRTVKVRVRRYNVTNTNPFTTHGNCVADVKNGAFGASAALEASDFEAPADVLAAAILSAPPANLDWSEGLLNAAGRAALSTTGKTQMKLRFELDDNDDEQEDYLNFFGGENVNADYRPKLVVTYQQ